MKPIAKTGLILFFAILGSILIGICINHVIADGVGFVAKELAEAANLTEEQAPDNLFWGNQISPGSKMTRYADSGDVADCIHWMCLSEKELSTDQMLDDILVRCILDINRYELGKWKSYIYGQGEKGGFNDEKVRQLAYLCYAATEEEGTGTAGQTESISRRAMYYFFNTTDLEYLIGDFSKKREEGDLESYNRKDLEARILGYAEEYATSEKEGSSAEITESSDNGAKVVVSTASNGTKYSYIGPFTIKTTGTIKSVTVKDGNKTVSVTGYANSVGGKVNDISGLPQNGNSFYIVTTDTLTNTNILLTINTSGAAGGGTITDPLTGKTTTGYIRARMVFITGSESQACVVFRGDIIPTEETTDSVTLTAKNNQGKIIIQKIGTYCGNTNYENVKNFGFKIYHLEGSTKRYVRINDMDTISGQTSISVEGDTSYTADVNSATTIYTSNNGTITIDNISTEYKYYIEETDTSNTNYATRIIGSTSQIGSAGATNLQIDGNITGPITVQLKGANNIATKIIIKDYRKIGDLTIEKVDKDDHNTKLEKVEFKLKNKDTGYYVIAEKTGEGVYNIPDPLKAYTKNEEEGTTFVTNSSGTIKITGLDVGNYEIIEISNSNYGYTVLPNNVSVTVTDSNMITQTVENEKQTGNIRIEKQDADNAQTKLSNVSFRIYRETSDEALGSGYVVGLQGEGDNLTEIKTATGKVHFDNMTVTNDPERATIFVTDENGLVEIYNILKGTYTVEEISVGDKYGYYLNPNLVTWEVTASGGATQTTAGTTSVTLDVSRQPSTQTSGNASGTVKAENIIVKNEKQTGNLKIEKQDADDSQTKMDNVSFRIYRETSDEFLGSGYVVAMQGNSASSATAVKTATGRIYFDNMTVTQNANNATTFVTDENGLIEIYNILIGEYVVEEISVGDNFGYDIDPEFISWEITNSNGSKSTVNQSTSATVQVIRQPSTETKPEVENQGTDSADKITTKNTRKYIKIRGFAWEDRTDGKNSTKDYIWKENTEDKRLANIPVRLISNGRVLDEAITDENGEYVFGNYDEDSSAIKIEIDDLVGAYIEFTYNGMSYQSIVVNTAFDVSQETDQNGNTLTKYSGDTNKSSDEAERPQFNDDFSTISKGMAYNVNRSIRYDYDSASYSSSVIYGDNVLKGYPEQIYPIARVDEQYRIKAVTQTSNRNALCTDLTPETIRKNAVVEIGGLNLGVEERAMPDLFVLEDIQDVQISLNGYTHTYQYAQRFEDPANYAGGDPFDVTVRFESKYQENSYSREVYSSDVVYNESDEGKGNLEIYIRYIVKITNESSVYTRLNTLANYYDNRYESVSASTSKDNSGNLSIEGPYRYNESLNRVNIITGNDYLIAPNETKDLYITYKLNNNAINALLNQKLTLESVSEVASYSSYSDAGSTHYAGIDVDSAADSVVPKVLKSDGEINRVNIEETLEDDTDKAPSLILSLKEGRMIAGTVWEDKAIEELLDKNGYEKERKGDGIYTTDENVVKDVKVELLTVKDNAYQESYLYQWDKDNNTTNEVKAECFTDEKGNYIFSGVIPANYVLRYTYGNSSVICDAYGNEVKQVETDKYKSTIYRGGDPNTITNPYWYRGETSNVSGISRLSDARDISAIKKDGTPIEDIVTYRIDQEEYNYKSVTEGLLETISADSAQFEIKLDYDVNLDNTSAYGADLKFVFDQIDFGIIERPKQSLEVKKEVANIQIVLANGNDLINGDPRTANLSGVRVLDDDVYIEIDNEIIQGATLRITYAITVDNTGCEIDYKDPEYYIYGKVPTDPKNNFKIATVKDMYDYLPEDLIFQEENGGNWERVNMNEENIRGNILAEEVYTNVKNQKNVVHLSKDVFGDMEPGNQRTDTSLVVSKQLAPSSDDLTYENDIEIVELKGRKVENSIPGNYDPTTNKSYDPGAQKFNDDNEPDDDKVEVTITPPTGETAQYGNNEIIQMIGIGVVMLVIVGVSIVIIKKKIL